MYFLACLSTPHSTIRYRLPLFFCSLTSLNYHSSGVFRVHFSNPTVRSLVHGENYSEVLMFQLIISFKSICSFRHILNFELHSDTSTQLASVSTSKHRVWPAYLKGPFRCLIQNHRSCPGMTNRNQGVPLNVCLF